MKEEKGKKSYLGLIIIACIIVVTSISVAVYFCFYQKNINGVQENNSKDGKEHRIIFYKGNNEISSFNCDGECLVYSFSNNYETNDIKTEYSVKNPTYDGIEGIQNIDLSKSKYVLIEYCKKETCDFLVNETNDLFIANDNKNKKDIGTVVLFDVETGKFKEYKDVDSVNTIFLDEGIAVLNYSTDELLYSDGEEKVYANSNAILLSDGTYRKLSNKISMTCYEGCWPDLLLGDNIGTINVDGKYGIENIKTGKELMVHKYEDINKPGDVFYYELDEINNKYIVVKDQKVNLYDYSGKQLTNNGYDAIYLINNDISNLFAYNNGEFYFINSAEEIISNKIKVDMKTIGAQKIDKYSHDIDGLPHEGSVMFKNGENNINEIRIVPDFNSDNIVSQFYEYDTSTKTMKKVTDKKILCKYWDWDESLKCD